MDRFIILFTAACYFVIPMAQGNVCLSEYSPPQYQFYPNVTSRSTFVQCLNNSGTFSNASYTCPDGLVFRPRTSHDDLNPLCVSNSGPYGMATFDCSRNKNGNGSYSGDKTLYATCKNGVPNALHQCPLGEYQDPESLVCNRSCTLTGKDGIFPTADGGYYTCRYDYIVRLWVMTTHSCGQQKKYNSDYQFCLLIPSSTTPASTTTAGDETSETSSNGGGTPETTTESVDTTQPTQEPSRSGGGNILSKVWCVIISLGDDNINTCDS